MKQQVIDYVSNSKLVGAITIPQLLVFKCDQCDDMLFNIDSCETITITHKTCERLAIDQLPNDQFIGAGQLAQLLNKSLRLVKSNKRINRGFIIHKKIGKRKLYYKPSVDQYIKTGDGRILIV